MSSLDKMLAIMAVFDDDTLAVDVAQVATITGASRATAYRYLQALTKAGLLTHGPEGSYVIGSRAVELARLKTENDPLVAAARHKIRYHAHELGVNVMLCSFYGDRVMCADSVWSGETPAVYRPGHAIPIFRGAMGKVILAHLPVPRLRSIYRMNAGAIRASGLGDTPEGFLAAMRAIRDAGVVTTCGEVVAGLVGIAAPVFAPDGQVMGSIVYALRRDRYDALDPAALGARLSGLAADIAADLPRSGAGPAAMKPVRNAVFSA